MSDNDVISALNILKRLPSWDIETNVACLSALKPDVESKLISRIDLPLKIALCNETKKKFVCFQYNSEGVAYRNPYTNLYTAELDGGGYTPSDRLRSLEISWQAAFQKHIEAKYASTSTSYASSVYCWDLSQLPSDGAETSLSFGVALAAHLEQVKGEHASKQVVVTDIVHVFSVTPSPSGTSLPQKSAPSASADPAAPSSSSSDEPTRPSFPFSYKASSSFLSSSIYGDGESDPDSGVFRTGHRISSTLNEPASIELFSDHISNIEKLLEKQEKTLEDELKGKLNQSSKHVIELLKRKGNTETQ
jgi:F-actin capping protein, beta subunit